MTLLNKIPSKCHPLIRVCMIIIYCVYVHRNQNVGKRIVASNKNLQLQQQQQKSANEEREANAAAISANNRLETAAVAAKILGKTAGAVPVLGLGGVGMLNQDTGESLLKGFDIDRKMLRDSTAAGGGKGSSSSATTTTTEKYPMQWGYQILPTLYSIYQKVLVPLP